jgi:hypothetical protein
MRQLLPSILCIPVCCAQQFRPTHHAISYATTGLTMQVSPISHTVNLINTDKVIQTGIHGINLPVSGDLPTYLLPYLFGKNKLHPDWNSLRIYEYAEGNTMVMCYLNETHPTAPHKYTVGFEHDPGTTKYLSLLEESVMTIHNAGIDICNSMANLDLLNSRSLPGPCHPWRPSTY